MIILHIDEQTGWRGGEQQASYLIQGLAERGHTNLIAGRRGSAFVTASHGEAVALRIEAPFRGECDPVTALRLACAIRSHQVEIVHAHSSHAHTYACVARFLARRGKVIVSRRVDFPPKRHAINRWKYRQPDRIIAISARIGEVLSAFGVPEEKLSVVHSCIDPKRFDVQPVSRAELGIPEEAPLLGNVAALVGHKDHATLLDAMPAVLRELPGLHLVILGEGTLRPSIEAKVAALGLGHAVHLLGFRNDVPRVLHALDAFVLSSKMEGLGTSVLDAMACRLPVVATTAGGIPEMVRDGETGLLVPAGDAEGLARAIVRVFRDRALAEALGRKAHARVMAEFTVDRMVEGNLDVYASVLGGSR